MLSGFPSRILACAAAYGLDLACGDPEWLPHPVRAIGALIRGLERLLYRRRGRFWAGVALLLTTVGITLAVVALLLALAGRGGPSLRFLVSVTLIWMALATRSLLDHAEAVRRPLAASHLEDARAAVARMVSRDTQALDAVGVARACIESLAENLTDGCLSPLLFALAGGPIAAWGLKAVSTLDSMVGYRNARYAEFGWASARCDDLAHYLPARLLWVILPVASWCCGADARGGLRALRRDGGKTESPNSGLAEAGVAGALGAELGGPGCYAGEMVEKARLNPGAAAPQTADIRRAQRLVLVASALPLLAVLPFAWS
jgi:adenosylcobinamide-phosphate synthase